MVNCNTGAKSYARFCVRPTSRKRGSDTKQVKTDRGGVQGHGLGEKNDAKLTR